MASGDSLLVFDSLSNRPPPASYASVDLRNGFVVLDFDDTSNETAIYLTTLPSQFSGGQFVAVVTWTSTTATTGNAKLLLETTRIANGVNLDSLPAADASINLTVAAPTSSGDLVMSQTLSWSSGSAAAGDLLLVKVTRLASDVADTLVGDVELVSLEIREA